MSAVGSAISSMGFAYASASLLRAIALLVMGLMWAIALVYLRKA
ncbi:hypothetical protein [Nostoc sp.]